MMNRPNTMDIVWVGIEGLGMMRMVVGWWWRKRLLGEVLCERWVGDREVGDDESGGRESVEIWFG